MDNIMILKYHSGFKYVHGSKFPRHSKNKICILKMFVDLLGSGVDFVKHIQIGGYMENLWIMFNQVKCLKDWTTLMCHIYYSKNCKVLTIAYFDIQSRNGVAQILV